jgi:hypothetical protein
MDMHGNNHNPVVTGYTEARACLNAEVYENDFSSDRTTAHRWMHHRGGALLMYSNRMTKTNTNSYIRLAEEDLEYYDALIPAICTHGGQKYICLQDHTSSAGDEPGTGGGAAYWATTVLTPSVAITWAEGIAFQFSTPYDPIIDTYIWDNKENGSEASVTFSDAAVPSYIVEDTNYFLANPVGETIKGGVYAPYTYPHPLTIGDSGDSVYNVAPNIAEREMLRRITCNHIIGAGDTLVLRLYTNNKTLLEGDTFLSFTESLISKAYINCSFFV